MCEALRVYCQDTVVMLKEAIRDFRSAQRSICFTHWKTEALDYQANHVTTCGERNIKFIYLRIYIECLLFLNAFNQYFILQTIVVTVSSVSYGLNLSGRSPVVPCRQTIVPINSFFAK
jgi:hypothetical protein